MRWDGLFVFATGDTCCCCVVGDSGNQPIQSFSLEENHYHTKAHQNKLPPTLLLLHPEHFAARDDCDSFQEIQRSPSISVSSWWQNDNAMLPFDCWINLFTVQSAFLVLFAGIISLHTVNNRLQILQDQNMTTRLNQMRFECNLFRGPYQFNYAVFLFRESRCNHWRGWKWICFLIYLCKLGLPPVAADDFICLSGVPVITGLQSGCWKIVCGPACSCRSEQVY